MRPRTRIPPAEGGVLKVTSWIEVLVRQRAGQMGEEGRTEGIKTRALKQRENKHVKHACSPSPQPLQHRLSAILQHGATGSVHSALPRARRRGTSHSDPTSQPGIALCVHYPSPGCTMGTYSRRQLFFLEERDCCVRKSYVGWARCLDLRTTRASAHRRSG